MAATPNPIRITAATSPPISKNLRMILSPSIRVGLVSAPSTCLLLSAVSTRRWRCSSWRARNALTGFPQPPECASVEQSALERPAHELGATREAELLHQASALGLDRADRDVQLARHIAIRVAIGEQESCSLLAFRELVRRHTPSLAPVRTPGIGKRTPSGSVLSTGRGVLREDRTERDVTYCCDRAAKGGNLRHEPLPGRSTRRRGSRRRRRLPDDVRRRQQEVAEASQHHVPRLPSPTPALHVPLALSVDEAH